MYYSKSKLNSLYGKTVNVILNKKGYGKAVAEKMKEKRKLLKNNDSDDGLKITIIRKIPFYKGGK